MIPSTLDAFDRIVVVDTEIVPVKGNPPLLVALGYQVLGDEQVRVYSREELLQWTTLPFPCDRHTLTIAYNVPAEAAFLHVLGREQPVWWLDPMVEDQVRRTVCISKKKLNRFTKAHPEMY